MNFQGIRWVSRCILLFFIFFILFISFFFSSLEKGFETLFFRFVLFSIRHSSGRDLRSLRRRRSRRYTLAGEASSRRHLPNLRSRAFRIHVALAPARANARRRCGAPKIVGATTTIYYRRNIAVSYRRHFFIFSAIVFSVDIRTTSCCCCFF